MPQADLRDLPVNDLNASNAFFSALGFAFEPNFGNELRTGCDLTVNAAVAARARDRSRPARLAD